MAKTEHYYTQFEPDRFYHVYNRSVDQKPMFTQVRNYEYFLEKMNLYLTPFLDVYAYCLMNNHFHLLIKVKGWEVFEEMEKSKGGLIIKDLTTSEKLSNQKLSNLPIPKLPDVHKITAHC